MTQLSSGLRAYQGHVDIMLGWLNDGPINQHEFDRKVSSAKWPVLVHDPDTYLLHWTNPYLDLMQHMVREGLVKRSVNKGLVTYSLKGR